MTGKKKKGRIGDSGGQTKLRLEGCGYKIGYC